MLGIVTMAGNALRSFGSIHPAIKWGVVAIVGLLAVEFIAREGIALWRDARMAPLQVQQTQLDIDGKTAIIAPLPAIDDVCALDNKYRPAFGCK